MPLPAVYPIIGGISLLLGFLGGALSRQPEINELKEQVRRLQVENSRLQRAINEQDRQINELIIRYNTLRAYQLIERNKYKPKIKGEITYQYCFKEYINILTYAVNNPTSNLTGHEKAFYNIFQKQIDNNDLKIEEKLFLREYIRQKYDDEIDSLISPDLSIELNKVGIIYVDN